MAGSPGRIPQTDLDVDMEGTEVEQTIWRKGWVEIRGNPKKQNLFKWILEFLVNFLSCPFPSCTINEVLTCSHWHTWLYQPSRLVLVAFLRLVISYLRRIWFDLWFEKITVTHGREHTGSRLPHSNGSLRLGCLSTTGQVAAETWQEVGLTNTG